MYELNGRFTNMTTVLTICDTCKRPGFDPETASKTDGTLLAELTENTPVPEGVTLRRVSCLMGCEHGCNVAIQADNKLTYVLGRFEPDAASAQAILEYAGLHAASETGQVPFRQWPQGVKGHFVSRIPALPKD